MIQAIMQKLLILYELYKILYDEEKEKEGSVLLTKYAKESSFMVGINDPEQTVMSTRHLSIGSP